MKISVVTVTYNCGSFLPRCIESVSQQLQPEYEHVIVNCGSTDNTARVLEKWAHSKTKIYNIPFCNLVTARRIALSFCDGYACAVLDADDVAYPDRLQQQLVVLKDRPTVTAVGGSFHAEFEGSATFDAKAFARPRVVRMPSTDQELRILLNAALNPIAHSTLMFRMADYKRVGGYDPIMQKCEDFDLVTRLATFGDLYSIKEAVGVLRFGRTGSHSRAHVPLGREECFYTLLSLLRTQKTLEAEKVDYTAIASWVDALSRSGRGALHCNLLIKALFVAMRRGSLTSLPLLSKTLIRKLCQGFILREFIRLRHPRDLSDAAMSIVRGNTVPQF